jgi:hypothetical protein
LDLSKPNQLLNYGLSARSKRFLQIVDTSLETSPSTLIRIANTAAAYHAIRSTLPPKGCGPPADRYFSML